MDTYSYFGPDTSMLDAALAQNGGFFLETPMLDTMIEANGGFYGPDISWIQDEMNQLYDPTNPYMTNAMIETTGDFYSVSNSVNAAWSDYITG